MRVVGRIIKWFVALVVVVVIAAAGWLYASPPDLIRVATAYSAKIVCSNHFLAGREPNSVLAIDVQAPGHPLLGYVYANVDAERGVVTARLLGLFGDGRAVHRPGMGCSTLPAGATLANVSLPAVEAEPADAETIWPAGARVEPSQDPRLAAILDDTALTGSGMRAVVVVHNGRIVGERYADGFSADTPLLGWSMTKTVTAAPRAPACR